MSSNLIARSEKAPNKRLFFVFPCGGQLVSPIKEPAASNWHQILWETIWFDQPAHKLLLKNFHFCRFWCGPANSISDRDRFLRALALFQEMNASPDAAATNEALQSIR